MKGMELHGLSCPVIQEEKTLHTICLPLYREGHSSGTSNAPDRVVNLPTSVFNDGTHLPKCTLYTFIWSQGSYFEQA